VSLETNAILFDHPIYPYAPFTVALDYLTQIVRSENGFEQRRARRERPRKTLTLPVRAGGACYRSLLRELHINQRAPFAVPDLSRRIASISTMPAASTQITVASVPVWLAGSETVILIDKSRVETRTVSSIGSGGVITFNEVNSTEWPIGTKIAPALSCRFNQSAQARRSRNDFAELTSLTFDVVPMFERYDEPAAASSTFNSRELFITPPRDVQPVSVRHLGELETIDFGAGAVAFREPVDFNTLSDSFVYEGCSQSASAELVDLFVRNRGRRTSFYAPTFSYDLLPVGSSSGTTLTVATADVAAKYGGSPAQNVFKNIAVQYADGTWQAIAVSSFAENGSNTDLTLGTALSSSVSPSTVRRISWLLRRRFASDRLQFDWFNDRATVTLPLQSLEDV